MAKIDTSKVKMQPEAQAPRRDDYAPYHLFDSFAKGVSDYSLRNYDNPYGNSSVDAQAWDRGLEYGLRVAQHEYRLATAGK